MKTRIPDRWLPYQALGQRIPGTRFISFKVPLTDAAFHQMPVDIKFTPEILMEQCPTLQFIVDLTNTHKYYNGKVFTDRGLKYKKILTPGHVIPGAAYVKEFFDTVDAFLSMPAEPDSLIGVHCTHGLNRTSYFICCYMIHRLGFEPKVAIEAFEEARGHKIERNLYIEDLLKRGMGSKENDVVPAPSYNVRRHVTPYERPQGRPGRDARRRSRWDAAPPPLPPPPPPALARTPYNNPYTVKRTGPSPHYPQNYHSRAPEQTFGYTDFNRPPPGYLGQPYQGNEYPSHHGGSRDRRAHGAPPSASSTPYNDRLQGRGRGGHNRHT